MVVIVQGLGADRVALHESDDSMESNTSEVDNLCSFCQQLFLQPHLEPTAIPKPEFCRLGADIHATADLGCQFCTVMWGKCRSLLGHRIDVNELELSSSFWWDTERTAFGGVVFTGQTVESVYPELFTIDLYLESGKLQLITRFELDFETLNTQMSMV